MTAGGLAAVCRPRAVRGIWPFKSVGAWDCPAVGAVADPVDRDAPAVANGALGHPCI